MASADPTVQRRAIRQRRRSGETLKRASGGGFLFAARGNAGGAQVANSPRGLRRRRSGAKRKSSMSEPKTRWIADWNPEDATFWESKGKAIAKRNLIWSIIAEHLGFSIWLIWSIVATKLPAAGFHFTTDQLFQLVALPGLIGSLMRFPYTFAVTTFGGRNWTVFSASVLLVPTLCLAYFVGQPDTPFWLMLLVASCAGLGGGTFASSMANIS